MDASAFDRLTQAVGSRSRRSALRSAVAGTTMAAAGLLVSATGSGAKKKRKRCKKCHGKARGDACATNKECCANETRLACAFASGNRPVCCGVLGAPCGVDGDCCRGFTCLGSSGCGFLI